MRPSTKVGRMNVWSLEINSTMLSIMYDFLMEGQTKNTLLVFVTGEWRTRQFEASLEMTPSRYLKRCKTLINGGWRLVASFNECYDR